MKYVTFIKELTKKMCRYFTIYIDVECNIRRLFFQSQICPTSRLNFHILKKVLETRHLEGIDYKIKTRWYMTHGDLNLKIKKATLLSIKPTILATKLSQRTNLLEWSVMQTIIIKQPTQPPECVGAWNFWGLGFWV